MFAGLKYLSKISSNFLRAKSDAFELSKVQQELDLITEDSKFWNSNIFYSKSSTESLKSDEVFTLEFDKTLRFKSNKPLWSFLDDFTFQSESNLSNYDNLELWVTSKTWLFCKSRDIRICRIQEELKTLQIQLKMSPRLDSILHIKRLLILLKDLTLRRFIKLKKLAKTFCRKLLLTFRLNARFVYRKIIHFHFKNLDDEFHLMNITNGLFIKYLFIIRKKLNETIQGAADNSTKRCYLF